MRTERILVLMGGEPPESDISRRSGAHILKALKSTGYEAVGVELDADFPHFIMEYKPDLVFLALHGCQGENGAIQGFLEVLGIPYTGSGIAVSAICIDKVLTKKMLAFDEIPTPEFAIINQIDYADSERIIDDLLAYPGLPLVVKPARQGSSIGASFVKEPAELKAALERAFDYGEQILVERYIKGIEVTVAAMGNREAYMLPALEIVPRAGEIYDYNSKHAEGGSQHLSPPRLPPAMLRKVEALAQASYERLGCRGCARIDIMADVEEGKAYVLEVNTIPGMSPASLLPDAVKTAGMSWEEFVDRVARLALAQR